MRHQAIASKARPRLSLVSDEAWPDGRQPWSQVARDRAKTDIREARSSEDREALYRFRYTLQLKGPQRTQLVADHGRKRLEDDLNSDGVNLLALRQSRVVGSIRINYASQSDLGIHEDFFRMRETAGVYHPSRTCILSGLTVDPALRGSRLGYRLCMAAYKHALDADVRFAFINCADDLIFYFSVLGFKAYMGRAWHKELGEVLPMRLDLPDEKYLMMIGSPLLPTLRAWKQSRQVGVRVLSA